METRVPVSAIWLWPLAVVLGVATMSLAVLAAWIADRALMALPHWMYPVFPAVAMMTVGVVGVVAAIRRRRKTASGPGLRDAKALR
jgi:hypothetical protein